MLSQESFAKKFGFIQRSVSVLIYRQIFRTIKKKFGEMIWIGLMCTEGENKQRCLDMAMALRRVNTNFSYHIIIGSGKIFRVIVQIVKYHTAYLVKTKFRIKVRFYFEKIALNLAEKDMIYRGKFNHDEMVILARIKSGTSIYETNWCDRSSILMKIWHVITIWCCHHVVIHQRNLFLRYAGKLIYIISYILHNVFIYYHLFPRTFVILWKEAG